jgi:hypothetical protein
MSKKNNINNIIPIKSNILSIFNKKFPSDIYKVWYNTYEPNEKQIYISISSLYKKSDPCIELSFNKTTMNITSLHRCIFTESTNISNSSNGLGNQTIKHIIKIGGELNLKHLELIDSSSIVNPYKSECSINLSIYKILIEGQSWYNKHGFKSINHDKEKLKWDLLREENFVSIFLNFKDNIINKEIALLNYICNKHDVTKILDKYSKLQNNIFIFLDEYSIKFTAKVKDVFKVFEKERLILVGKKNIKEFYCMLSELADLFKENIKYTQKLIYNY